MMISRGSRCRMIVFIVWIVVVVVRNSHVPTADIIIASVHAFSSSVTVVFHTRHQEPRHNYYYYDHQYQQRQQRRIERRRRRRRRIRNISSSRSRKGWLYLSSSYSYLDTISNVVPQESQSQATRSTRSGTINGNHNSNNNNIDDNNNEDRDIQSLSIWALDNGILLAPGIQLTEDAVGDWSVSIVTSSTTTSSTTEQQSQQQEEQPLLSSTNIGRSIMTIPSHLILSSDLSSIAATSTTANSGRIRTSTTTESSNDVVDEQQQQQQHQLFSRVYQWIETQLLLQQQQQQQNGSTSNTHSYLPEFFLIFRILYELYLGPQSRWDAWIQSLPKTFSTGLYLDEIEQSYLKRTKMGSKFVTAQQIQYTTFSTILRDLILYDNNNELESQQQQQQQQERYFDNNNGGSMKQTPTVTILPASFRQWLRGIHNEEEEAVNRSNNNNMLLYDDQLLRWAFSIVFTRSWRTPNNQHATIVPLGDMINHHSQYANVRPYIRPSDNALQLCLTETTLDQMMTMMESNVVGEEKDDNGSTSSTKPATTTTTQTTTSSAMPLYLNYGFTTAPSRFVSVFGFCDTSALYIDAQIDDIWSSILLNHQSKQLGDDDGDDGARSTMVDNTSSTMVVSSLSSFQLILVSMLDPSTLLLSTRTGAVTEEVWFVFLYQVLQDKYQNVLQNLEIQFNDSAKDDGGKNEDDDDDDELKEQQIRKVFDDLLWKYEVEVATKMKDHYQQLIHTQYQPMDVTDQDFLDHPNLRMIYDYVSHMRTTFLQVIDYIDQYLVDQSKEIQNNFRGS